ncbi:MAG: hypothetical protein J0M02_08975 [Planctomycetes bacterium]|nr:hypothetical protein [Planctomycetota bacterium]
MRIAILAALAAAAGAADVKPLPIVNGSMSQGTDQCTGWDKRWNGGGTVTVARDTKMFKEAPAALRIETSGDAKGNVYQMIEVAGGSTFDLSGFMKSEGVKVQVFVQAFNAEWKPIDYQMLKNAWEPCPEWTSFSAKITVPAEAVRVGVGIAIDGNGKAWLDEVRNTADAKAK